MKRFYGNLNTNENQTPFLFRKIERKKSHNQRK